MGNESQIRANVKYRKKCTQLNIVFYPSEKELVEHLEAQENKTGYIKELIKSDMESNRVLS